MKMILTVILLSALPAWATMPLPANLVRAIHMVESEGQTENVPAGDNGKAIGPFQIHKVYWQDATDFDKSIGGQYQDCQNYDYSLKIITAYMNRHAYKYINEGNLEAIARIHNGGPKGYLKEGTKGYWQKVKAQLSIAFQPTKLLKLHLIRPDLIGYPISFEHYC